MRVIIDDKDGYITLKAADYEDSWGVHHKKPTAFIDNKSRKAIKDLIIRTLFEKFKE